MKQNSFIALLVLFCTCSHAQVTVYAKFTLNNGTLLDEGPVAESHKGQILLSSYSIDAVQVLNIGSQSTGAGAGRIAFDPVSFTKPVSINSPQFFSMMCAGTPFKKVEFYFYNAGDKLYYMESLGIVAFKTITHSVAASCPTPGCLGFIETCVMEYGKKVETFYPQDPNGSPGKPVSMGWDRIKNVSLNDPAGLQ